MNNQKWMSQNFFIYFFTWGIFLPYWTGWLVSAKEISVPEASLIMAMATIMRGIFSMVVYPIFSKLWSQEKILLGGTILSLLISLTYIPSSSLLALFLVTLGFSAVYPTLLAVIESMASILVQNKGISYGRSRSYGSLGYISAVLIISVLTGYFGDNAILYGMIFGLVILLLWRIFPAPEELKTGILQQEQNENQYMMNLVKQSGFIIMLLVVFLLQGAHASYYNYGYLYLQKLNVTSYLIGVLLNVAIIAEIVFLSLADHYFSSWRPSSLLLVAAIGSSVRWFLYLFPNKWIFIFSQILHSLSFAMAHYAFIRYLTKYLPSEQHANAQGLYSALAMSFSTAILTFGTGFLYVIKSELAFLGMLICTIPAIFIIIGMRRKYIF